MNLADIKVDFLSVTGVEMQQTTTQSKLGAGGGEGLEATPPIVNHAHEPVWPRPSGGHVTAPRLATPHFMSDHAPSGITSPF